MSKPLAHLFETRPEQWGLRGDSELWDRMERDFSETVMPASGSALIEKIEAAFELITRAPLMGTEEFSVEGFKKMGMSGGMVSREFWIQRAIPLLVWRLAEFHEAA